MSMSDMGGGSSKPPPPPPPRIRRPPPPPPPPQPRPVKKQDKKPQAKRPSPPPPRPVQAQAKPAKDQTKPAQTQPVSGPAAGSPKPAPAGTASARTGSLLPAGGLTAGGPKPAPAGKASAATDAGAPPPVGGQTAGDPKPAPAGTASVQPGPLAPAGGQTAASLKPPPAGIASVPSGARGAQPGAPIPPATPTSLMPGVRAAARGPSTPTGKNEPDGRRAAERPGATEAPADDLRLRRPSPPRQESEPTLVVSAGDSARFDAAAAFKNLKSRTSDAADTQGADPPGMLHEARERWLGDVESDALDDAIIDRPKSAIRPTEATAPAGIEQPSTAGAQVEGAPGQAPKEGPRQGVTYEVTVHRHAGKPGTWTSTELLQQVAVEADWASDTAQAKKLIAKGDVSWFGRGPIQPTKDDISKGWKVIRVFDKSLTPTSANDRAALEQAWQGISPAERADIRFTAAKRFKDKTKLDPNQAMSPANRKYLEELGYQVLRERQQITRLPDETRRLLLPTWADQADLPVAAEDYPVVLRIANRLEQLSDDQIADYASMTSRQSRTWREFEQSVSAYVQRVQARSEATETIRRVAEQLEGLDAAYQTMRAIMRSTVSHAFVRDTGSPPTRIINKMERDLKAHGFSKVNDLTEVLDKYVERFRNAAVALAEESLARERHLLQLARRDVEAHPEQARALGARVAASGARGHFDAARNYHTKAVGAVALSVDGNPVWAAAATRLKKLSEDERGAGAAAVLGAAWDDPIVQLPSFDLESLARTPANDVPGLVKRFIDRQQESIDRTLEALHNEPELVFQLDQLLEATKTSLHVRSGTILDRVIADHAQDERDSQATRDLVAGIVATAAVVLTDGAAIPAVLAATGSAALSLHNFDSAVHRYIVDDDAYGHGLSSTKPSIAPVVLSGVGALLEAVGALRSMRGLVGEIGLPAQTRPPASVSPPAPVTQVRTAGPEVWEELAKELETTPTTSLTNWTIPGKWSSAKPLAYNLIFGEKMLPEINRPGNIQMTLGHLIEKATGGTHSLDNLMPQLNKVNVRLSGIYSSKTFALPLPNGEMKIIKAINGKAINGTLREAFQSGAFSPEEQRAISYFITSMVITPELEAELADLIRKIPNLQSLVP
jgi:hypothetical protein